VKDNRFPGAQKGSAESAQRSEKLLGQLTSGEDEKVKGRPGVEKEKTHKKGSWLARPERGTERKDMAGFGEKKDKKRF